jgi:hypothetical protein
VSAVLRTPPVRALAALAGIAALGAACAPKPQPQAAAPGPRIYAVDVQGRSALCDTPPGVNLAAGGPTEATMVMGNDGGWCGIRTDRAGPGLVTARPAHGRVHVRKVGATTRVDYIPDRGFVGTDTFTVRLLPDQAEMRIAATVQGTSQEATVTPASAAAASPPNTPAPATRRTAPARR